MEIREALAFDDVLLKPKCSDITSRSEVDLTSELSRDFVLTLPVISAPMDTVTEYHMANAMSSMGGLGIIHRYNTIEEQVAQLHLTSYKGGCAIGTNGDSIERATELVKAGCKLICVDVAHGHHMSVFRTIAELRKRFSQLHIMAGNVATWNGARDLAAHGADSIKIGIGGGSICSTRTMTGHGVPTFQAILDCFDVKIDFPNVALIADGGIKTPGDIVKSLAAGADFVMLGSMLAGTYETPGDIIEDYEGRTVILSNHVSKKYKVYRGMASKESQIAWRGKVASLEGISTKIPLKGSVKDILENIRTNVASGLSYSGARNLAELRYRATFIKQTHAGCVESSTHILNAGGIV